MKTFKIKNGDLVFDSQNNIEMVEGKDEEIQSIERILTTNKGEWFLNILHGLNYDDIQGKGKSKESIKLAITEAIFQDDRVDDLIFLDVNFNRIERKLNIKFKLKMTSGNILEHEEEVLN